MNKEYIKKRIDYLRDERNHLWVGLIVTTGGTLALLFNLNSPIKTLFFILGIIFSIVFLFGYFKKDDQIEKFFKMLQKDKEKK